MCKSRMANGTQPLTPTPSPKARQVPRKYLIVPFLKPPPSANPKAEAPCKSVLVFPDLEPEKTGGDVFLKCAVFNKGSQGIQTQESDVLGKDFKLSNTLKDKTGKELSK